jgi:hypothetical protein
MLYLKNISDKKKKALLTLNIIAVHFKNYKLSPIKTSIDNAIENHFQ